MRLTIRRSQVWKDGLDKWNETAKNDRARIIAESTREVFEEATSTQPSVKQTGGSYQEGAIALDTEKLWRSQRVTVNGSTVASGPGSADGVPERITQRTNVSLWFDAPYARFHEHGTRNFGGRFFIRNAKQKWLGIVGRVAESFRT